MKTQTILVLKWIFAVIFLIGALGTLGKGNILSGLAFLSIGLILLPPLTPALHKNFPFFTNKGVTVGVLVGFLVLAGIGSKVSKADSTTEKKEDKAEVGIYPDYFKAEAAKSIEPERKKNRDRFLNELKSNPIWVGIVVNKEVNAKYLPVLHCLSYAVAHSTQTEYAVAENLIKSLTNDENNFVTACGTFVFNGGYPKDLVEALERYRLKYNYYGKGDTYHYDLDKNKELIRKGYDLTPIFAMLDPNNKDVADAIYMAHSEGVSSWENPDNINEYKWPYLVDRQAYNNYLKETNPQSPHIVNYQYELTAGQLYSAYEDNEVAADNKYKDKTILLTGVVESIKKDFMDEVYIVVRVDGFLNSIHCNMKDDSQAGQVSKGYQYKFLGRCNGMILTSVMMENCEIIE